MPLEPDEAVLVEAARRGDAGAFEALFRRHHGTVFRLCRTYAGSDQDAMDLAQDVFIKAFRGLGRLADPAAFRAWLYTIARNVGRNAVTRRPPPSEALEEAQEPADTVSAEDRVLRAEARGLTEEILRTMPEGRPRQCAELFYLEDLEVAEVASRLDVSVSNVTTSLGRARAWLRRHLLLKLCELRGYAT